MIQSLRIIFFCIIIILRNGQEARKAEEIIMQTFKEIKVTWITQKPKQAENANVSYSIFSLETLGFIN